MQCTVRSLQNHRASKWQLVARPREHADGAAKGQGAEPWGDHDWAWGDVQLAGPRSSESVGWFKSSQVQVEIKEEGTAVHKFHGVGWSTRHPAELLSRIILELVLVTRWSYR